MEIKINVQKKHLYFLSLLVILIGGVLFVKGQSGNFGHSASDVHVYVGEEEMNLQDVFAGEGGMRFDGQKACSVIHSGNWRDILVVPSSWTADDCHNWARTIFSTNIDRYYEMFCIFADGNVTRSGSFKRNKDPTKFPDPDCGWNETA